MKDKCQYESGWSEAREQLRVDTLPDKDKHAYYRYMESVRHMRSLFDTSRDDGFQEGRAEGRTEGIQIGIDKGEKKKAIAIASKLKSMGFEIARIVEATGLSKKDIEKTIIFKEIPCI